MVYGRRKSVDGFVNVIWTGVTTFELAKAIETVIRNKINVVGVYHLVNNHKISKYDLLKLFDKYFTNNVKEIRRCDTIYSDKSLVNTRDDFKYTVPFYEEMISEMKKWMFEHREIYDKYFKDNK